MSTESRYSECRTCGGPVEFYDSPGGSWWSHFSHPADEHDADPILHYTDSRVDQRGEWWLEVQEKDRDALVQIIWRSRMPGFEPLRPEMEPDWRMCLADAEAIIEGRWRQTTTSWASTAP